MQVKFKSLFPLPGDALDALLENFNERSHELALLVMVETIPEESQPAIAEASAALDEAALTIALFVSANRSMINLPKARIDPRYVH